MVNSMYTSSPSSRPEYLFFAEGTKHFPVAEPPKFEDLVRFQNE
jgi:hypothetical protein